MTPTVIALPANTDREGMLPVDEFDQNHHERLERFVRRENVARFRHLLAAETSDAEREMLLALLNAEQGQQHHTRD